jgi:hypothetical protein
MVNESGAFARVLEHFPVTRKTRPGASHVRQNGTLFEPDKAIETDRGDDAATSR